MKPRIVLAQDGPFCKECGKKTTYDEEASTMSCPVHGTLND